MTKLQSPAVVMVMCTGNVCRSPMAEAAFTHFMTEAAFHQVWAQMRAGSQQWVEQLGKVGLIPAKQ